MWELRSLFFDVRDSAEVVAVQPSDDPDERPILVAEHWPGAIVGGLLLVRSGVTVRAGAKVLDPQVAARSCLY
jgi:hypothetical protein